MLRDFCKNVGLSLQNKLYEMFKSNSNLDNIVGKSNINNIKNN